MDTLALLLLADGRFPSGGHAHSAGIEAAVAEKRVHDPPTLESFVRWRLATTGLADAALTAATVAGHDLAALDAEAEARIAVPALREASRRLGRQLLRAGARCWPAVPAEQRLHAAVALGVVAAAAGVGAASAARLSLHHAAATPAQAALRLLGLDPFAVSALLASLAPVLEELAVEAAAGATGPLEALPCGTAAMCELAAADHAARDDRLFVT